MNMFEKASRLKIRFVSNGLGGTITTEDLWDLPLTSAKGPSLDGVAKELNRSIKANEEESFVTTQTTANSSLSLGFDIVKHVIKIRMEENELKLKAVENKALRERILEIKKNRKNAELDGMEDKDLDAMLEKLI